MRGGKATEVPRQTHRHLTAFELLFLKKKKKRKKMKTKTKQKKKEKSEKAF